MKRLGALLLALCMLFSLAPVASAANGTIKMTLNSNTMTVNGTSVKIDSDSSIKPQVKTVNGAGYTMLPLRAVVEAMGGTVAYDSASKVITMTYGGNTMKHTIGTKTATVNGASKSMSIASYAANNRTYVHLRAIELLSPSVKVNWSASAPNDVTISYPQTTTSTGTKNVTLTIKNACSTSYLQFTSLQLAPAGSTTYSGNLLNGTLILGGTRTLTMSIQPGKYDLKGTDINGNNFTWKNLDFSNVKSSATLTLTSGALYTLSIDNALTGTASSNVTVYNNTGAIITNIKAFQSTSTTPTEVYSGTLYSGAYTSVALPYGTGNNVYYLTVTFANGGQITYNYITVDGSYMTIALRGDGTFTYGGVTSGDGVYFVNRTGSSIKTLQMKLGKGGSWSTNLLDGTLKSGDYVLLDNVSTSELRNMTVYFRTTSSGSGKSVEVASSLKNSVVFYYGSSLSVKYNVDPTDVEYEEGLFLYNNTDIDFDYLYVINDSDFDIDDYEGDWDDVEDYFVDHDAEDSDDDDYEPDDYWEKVRNFDDGDEVLIDQWDADDLAKATLYFMGEYTEGSKTKYIYGSVTVGKSSKFEYNVYLEMETDSSGLDISIDYDYTEDEDYDDDYETGLLFYNRTGDEIDIYVSTSKALTKSNYSTDGTRVIKNLENKDWEQADDFDSYKKDVAGETIYYYVASDSSTASDSYGGSFSMKDSSSKTNACITLHGSSSSDERDYDWGIDDSDVDGVLYLYNDTSYDIDKLYIGIGSSKSKAKKDENISKISFSSFDDEECLVIDDVDLNDIDGMYIYVLAEFEDSSKDDFEDVIELYDTDVEDEEFDYVALRMKSGGSLSPYYDSDADKYID